MSPLLLSRYGRGPTETSTRVGESRVRLSSGLDLDDRRPDHYRGLGFFPLVWTIGFDRHRVIRGGIFLEPTRRRSKNGFVLRGCLSFRRTGFPAGAFPDDDAEDDGVALAIWRKLALKPRRNRVTSPPRK